MLTKKIKEIEKAIGSMATEKEVEVEIQERSANDPHSDHGLITEEIITTLTLYDKQELTPVKEFTLGEPQREMKVFVCSDHAGHWPVPTASVIVAPNKKEAKELLKAKLDEKELSTNWFTLRELDTTEEQVEMLSDGDY